MLEYDQYARTDEVYPMMVPGFFLRFVLYSERAYLQLYYKKGERDRRQLEEKHLVGDVNMDVTYLTKEWREEAGADIEEDLLCAHLGPLAVVHDAADAVAYVQLLPNGGTIISAEGYATVDCSNSRFWRKPEFPVERWE